MHAMLNIAVRAARRAGDFIFKSYGMHDKIEIEQKGRHDFVTNVDKQAEQLIVEVIRGAYPQHSILAEERGSEHSELSEAQWIIDPLDGTTNFIKGIPHFAVSIALKVKQRTEVGVVYDPVLNELFTAVRGQGAQLNGYRIRTSPLKELENALLGTGLPLKSKLLSERYFSLLQALFVPCADIRRSGSASLDLSYLAAGRLDGFFELDLKPWDFAAGELILKESGGIVTDFNGGHNYWQSGNIIAGNPRMVKELLTLIRDKNLNNLN